MRRKSVLALLVVLALAMTSAAPVLLRAQNAPARGGDDMPHRTVRAFAPFFRALVQHRLNTAQGVFKMRRSVEMELETVDNEQILSRFQKPDTLELNLIGGRTLGNNIGILLFTIATQDGPVAFKAYFYGFDKDIYVDRLDIIADWDVIEQSCTTLEMLPAPVTTPLSGQIDEGQ